MANIVRNLIEFIGISDTLPTNPKFFTEISIQETLKIPAQEPDIEQILSVMTEATVISTRFINTETSVSNEGQSLSGCKLVIELQLHEKVKYVADEPTQPVHVAEFTQFKSVFVVIPCQINGTDVCELIRTNKVDVNVFIEDIFAETNGPRTVFKNVTALVDVVFRT